MPPPWSAFLYAPVRHHAGYLAECLRSVANQTYANLEIIVVEGGTSGFGKQLLTQDLFGRGMDVLYLQDADGFNPARLTNTGLAAARGTYVLVVDDDQLLMSDHVERLCRAAEKDSQAVAAYAGARRVDTELARAEPLRYRESKSVFVANGSHDGDILGQQGFLPCCAVLFRKQIAETVGGCDSRITGAEMWDLWRRMGRHGDFVGVADITSVCRIPSPGPMRDAYEAEMATACAQVYDKEKAGTAQDPGPVLSLPASVETSAEQKS